MAVEAAASALCRLLELQSEAMDFYDMAKERCPAEVARAVFAVLGRDKRRLTAKLAAVQAALRAGQSLATACALVENGGGKAAFPPGLLERGETCLQDDQMLTVAFRLEEACLRHLENSLLDASDTQERFILDQALEEERRHWVLLSDLRQYLERPAGSSGND
ncbi:hypothetical protein NNJEOMEG_03702 [Fundidesulfovibrio magnetotacticus]|uniref:Rubrerythrin diiron-binding domain-containing protein n=1 Tax=Fundidesulfovibrio magnetotacticus TaxID=2730080 RepID=A0A6V8LZ59_9BACT|nr:hypothetical protein [Fundidesulfovibrio magnetotacticus]GFK95831.1 hypothetical protein NNJEOMEG_03702 [Fundidesulfovibrio magnetotacticus]